MKISSRGNVATVTFVGKIGLVASVGHFYRGDPVLIDNTVPVEKIQLSTKYDYFLGYCNLRMGAKLTLVYPKKGMTVIINNRHYEIVDIVDEYRWEVNGYFREGESGTAVYNENREIIGYVIESSLVSSIIPVFKAIKQYLGKIQNEATEQPSRENDIET